MGALHEDQYKFMIISCSIRLRMVNVSGNPPPKWCHIW